MPRLRATILGCGASPGVPRIGNDWGACDPNEPRNERSRCSLVIEQLDGSDSATTVLVDTGPDIRSQLLANNINKLNGVLYTHSHADHLHGIDDLRAFWLTSKELINIYADAATMERIEDGFSYCLRSPEGSFYPPILKPNIIEAGRSFAVGGQAGAIEVRPFRQEHGDIDSTGFRVGGLAYSCDVSDLPDESINELQDLDVWIVDALRYRSHPSHFSVEQSLEWIERIRPRRAILTHMHGDLDYRQLKNALPANVEPAYDGMVVEFD